MNVTNMISQLFYVILHPFLNCLYMLNHDLIDSLYKALPLAKRKELTHELFGEGRQSMAYFRRNRDVRLSKVEILSRYFDVPLDSLVVESKFVYDPVSLKIARKSVEHSVPVEETDDNFLQEKVKYLQEIASLRADKILYLEEKLAELTAKYEPES